MKGAIVLREIILVMIILLITNCFIMSSGTKFLTCDNYGCLNEGEIEGIAISNSGELILSNEISSMVMIPEAVIWSMITDGKDIYLGTGHEGKVYKYVISLNSLEMIYDAEEMEVMSLAIDNNNELYIGTSPNGKIYKRGRNGLIDVFSQIPEKNIYAMVFDKDGNLIVATGENGRIYKVNKNGEAEILLDTSETNITSLYLMEDGTILAGSYPNGILYRIKDIESYVIYDSDYDQISSIISKGKDIYFAGISIAELSGTQQPLLIPSKTISIDVSATSIETQSNIQQADTQKLQQQQILLMKGKKLTRSSSLYKIDANLRINKLYNDNENTIIYIVKKEQSNIIFSTSPYNSLILINDNGDYFLIFKSEGVVSNFLNDKRNIWFATSSPSFLYRIEDIYKKKGEYKSKVFDTGGISNWGKISWNAKVSDVGNIKCYTRTGNTASPDENWSKWSKAYVNSEGENIESPKARFIQFKCEINAKASNSTPILSDIKISYLEQNQKPVINKVELLPGVSFEKMPSSEDSKEQITNVQLSEFKISNIVNPSMQISKKKIGWLTIKWDANDPNNDKLLFDIYYANEKDMNWKILKKEVEDNFYSFDSTMLPDGYYKFKIEVSDKSSNSQEEVLSNYKIIDKYFILDNSQPVIQVIDIKNNANDVIILFKVIDEMSLIKIVEYAVDFERWNILNPLDYVFDSKIEQFELKLTNLQKGDYNIIIRAKDESGNLTTKNIVFKK